MHYVWTAAERSAIREASRRIVAYEDWLYTQRREREDSRKTYTGVSGDAVIAAVCPDSWRRQAAMGEEALRLAEIARGGKPLTGSMAEKRERAAGGERATAGSPGRAGMRRKRVA